MPKAKKKIVWLIMHYEFFDDKHIDCLQFHVSSTKKRAEAFITAVSVDAHSWWQVHPYILDDPAFLEEGREVYYYSHRGTPLKAPPYKRALAAYRKYIASDWYRSIFAPDTAKPAVQ